VTCWNRGDGEVRPKGALSWGLGDDGAQRTQGLHHESCVSGVQRSAQCGGALSEGGQHELTIGQRF
jgi:hypothetical protein